MTNHFLSYLDITRRSDAEEQLRVLTADLEQRVAERTPDLQFSNDKLEAANRTLSKLVVERDTVLRRSTTVPRTASRWLRRCSPFRAAGSPTGR